MAFMQKYNLSRMVLEEPKGNAKKSYEIIYKNKMYMQGESVLGFSSFFKF